MVIGERRCASAGDLRIVPLAAISCSAPQMKRYKAGRGYVGALTIPHHAGRQDRFRRFMRPWPDPPVGRMLGFDREFRR